MKAILRVLYTGDWRYDWCRIWAGDPESKPWHCVHPFGSTPGGTGQGRIPASGHASLASPRGSAGSKSAGHHPNDASAGCQGLSLLSEAAGKSYASKTGQSWANICDGLSFQALKAELQQVLHVLPSAHSACRRIPVDRAHKMCKLFSQSVFSLSTGDQGRPSPNLLCRI